MRTAAVFPVPIITVAGAGAVVVGLAAELAAGAATWADDELFFELLEQPAANMTTVAQLVTTRTAEPRWERGALRFVSTIV